ncbi:MAG: hypothetical protein E7315_04475 [Clostridiales bacterium]|nr:hypothetical protein [Clostridiales bacterium]
MSEILEIVMLISFGASWPFNIYRSYKAKSARGKSIFFLVFVFIGYICGIISKLYSQTYMADFSNKWYVLIFYCLNLIMVGVDIGLYVRNKRIDVQNEQNEG